MTDQTPEPPWWAASPPPLPGPAQNPWPSGPPPTVGIAAQRQPWRETGYLSLRGMRPSLLEPAAGVPMDVLRTLRGLDLSGCRLSAVPSWVPELPALETLDLSANRIAVLPAPGDHDGAWLRRLTALDLSENRLAELPGGWAACGRLRWLNVAGNRLGSLASLAGLPAIEVLDAGGNELRSLDGLPGPATLRSLDVSGNQLAELTPELAAFTALRRVDLSRNRLPGSELPVLADLPLTELFLDRNRIEALPAGLAGRRFQTLSLTGNPVTADAPEGGQATRELVAQHVSGGYERTVRYFDAPAYEFGFAISARDDRAAQELVDLYFKGYEGLDAELALADGQRVPLFGAGRRASLDFLAQQAAGPAAGARAAVLLRPANNIDRRDAAIEFAVESVTRVPGAELVATPTGERLAGRDTPAQPRVVNVSVADAAGMVLPAARSLSPLTEYLLLVGIGPEIDETIVLNPAPLALDRLTQAEGGGWWFDVVAASADVIVGPAAYRMFLPERGAGWTCPCTGDEHTCLPRERAGYLQIPFMTRGRPGIVSLRCTVYHHNNAVQSIRVTFTNGSGGRGQAALIHGVVDYSLASDLALADGLAPRRLSIVTNQSPATAGSAGSTAGSHTIVVKGTGTPAVAANLTEAGVAETLRAMRAELALITLGRDEQDSQYDADNAATPEQLTADLETLAYLGARFWQDAVPFGADRDVLRPMLASCATIQVARVTDTVFPWALVYDYPHLLDDPWEPCELLRRWTSARAALAGYPDACPFAAGHRLNTLCPYGFWGFRHLIEQPPSVARGLLRTTIPVPAGSNAAAVRSLNLDADLSARHLTRLKECLAPRFQVTDCDSRADFVAAIDTPLPLIYFYCHGRTMLIGDRGVDLTTPYLEIGSGEKLGTADLNAWADAGQWRRERWREVPPLVFINGCHTAAMSPEQLVTFVNSFAGAEAAGVIGTEIAVAQPVASEFAQRFYQHLLRGSADGDAAPDAAGLPVGQALRRTRLDLLAKGNVAGLVYTAFCSMDLTLGS